MARDLERFLHDEQVEACPPTVGYRMRKFLRKHRPLVSMVGAVVITLSRAVFSTFLGLREAQRERDAAEQARQTAAEQQLLAEKQRKYKFKTRTNLAQSAKYWKALQCQIAG